jgi:hypothetical protein
MSILLLVCFVLSLTAASASAGRWNDDWDDCDDDCGWDDCDDDCGWDDCNWGGYGFSGFDYFNFIDFGCDFFDDWYWFGCWC